MFEHSQKREIAKVKFQAVIHGAKMETGGNQMSNETGNQESTQENIMMFKDPAEYEKMTKEERAALTVKMMAIHKAMAKKKMGTLAKE